MVLGIVGDDQMNTVNSRQSVLCPLRNDKKEIVSLSDRLLLLLFFVDAVSSIFPLFADRYSFAR